MLKSGVARQLGGVRQPRRAQSPPSGALVGDLLRREGLDGVLREPTFPGKTSRLSPEALADLEAVMAEGRIATLKDAQAYLADHHGIVYPSLNGVWAQLRKHQITLKTGRRRHALADAATQEAFRAGFRDDAEGGRCAAGVGL